VDCILAGRRRDARSEIDRAVALDPRALLLAARLRYVLRDYQRALDDLDAAARRGSPIPALEMKFELAFRLGWAHDAIDAAERALEIDSGRMSFHLSAARLLTDTRCNAAALRHLELAMADPALGGDGRLAIAAAGIYATLRRAEDARRALRLGIERSAGALPAHLEAARIFIELGDFDAAEGHLRRAIEIDPRHAPAFAALGDLRLWSGEPGAARELAERAIAADPSSAEGYRLRGGTFAFFEGDVERAQADIDAALKLNPEHGEALIRRGEMKLRRSDIRGALADIDRGVSASGGFVLAARLIRLIATLEAGHQPAHLRHAIYEDVVDAVLELFPGERGAFLSGDPKKIQPLLQRALAALSGNRSATPTALREGPAGPSLVRLWATAPPRHAARVALELIRALPPSEALGELDSVVLCFPESAIPLCHRGELLLWLGHYAEARRDFDRAIGIERKTRWGYIGLGAVELCEGDPAAALATLQRGIEEMAGTTGPSLIVYRGEANRRLGRLDEALADLERSCLETPSRVGAWINLALACGEAGRGARRDEVMERLITQAPGLLSDAAAAVSVDIFDAGVRGSQGEREVLLRALEMMRGNRSSTCITYIPKPGLLRLVPKYPHAGPGPHDRDEVDIARVLKWLGASPR
jgi:tetratricopeptide (TPR) repeat protein